MSRLEAVFSVNGAGEGCGAGGFFAAPQAAEVMVGRSNPPYSRHQPSLLPASRTVEENPDNQVFSEIFKWVHFPSRGEQCVAGRELKPLASDKKPAAARRDDIKLVSSVGLLEISPLG